MEDAKFSLQRDCHVEPPAPVPMPDAFARCLRVCTQCLSESLRPFRVPRSKVGTAVSFCSLLVLSFFFRHLDLVAPQSPLKSLRLSVSATMRWISTKCLRHKSLEFLFVASVDRPCLDRYRTRSSGVSVSANGSCSTLFEKL